MTAETAKNMNAPACAIGIIIPSFMDDRILHTIMSIRVADPENISRAYIIDGGSSPRLVEDMRSLLRPQDVLISEPDRGIFDALNKGLDSVKEELIGWLGSDDFYTRNVVFNEVVQEFAHGGLDCLIFDTMYVDDYGRGRRSLAMAPTPENYRRGRLVLHYGSFWRRASIGSARFDLAYRYASDQDFFFSLVSRGYLVCKTDTRVGTVMRLGGASTKNFGRIVAANVETFRIYAKYGGALPGFFMVALKLVRKLVWKFTQPRYPVLKDFTNSVLDIAALSASGVHGP